MAKRRRLIPVPMPQSQFQAQAQAQAPSAAPFETKAFLRPSDAPHSAEGGPYSAAPPPIAHIAADGAAQSALAELSAAMEEARAEGRMLESLPLAQIETEYLVRDRLGADEEELGQLIASIKEHGQRSPIDVCALGPGRYGLISGWRRVQALLRLAREDEARFGTALALLRQPRQASDAYIAMVEENEVRHGLSYYERARIAARAVDLGVFATEKQALQKLFAASSRARRSKIGTFLGLYRQLDEVLRWPADMSERTGLALAKALSAAPERLADLRAQLSAKVHLAPEEQRILSAFIAPPKKPRAPETPPPTRQELRPGVFLEVTGGWLKPVLTLSGPGVDPAFRDALETWLQK